MYPSGTKKLYSNRWYKYPGEPKEFMPLQRLLDFFLKKSSSRRKKLAHLHVGPLRWCFDWMLPRGWLSSTAEGLITWAFWTQEYSSWLRNIVGAKVRWLYGGSALFLHVAENAHPHAFSFFQLSPQLHSHCVTPPPPPLPASYFTLLSCPPYWNKKEVGSM